VDVPARWTAPGGTVAAGAGGDAGTQTGDDGPEVVSEGLRTRIAEVTAG
jgi:hypothetical protein